MINPTKTSSVSPAPPVPPGAQAAAGEISSNSQDPEIDQLLALERLRQRTRASRLMVAGGAGIAMGVITLVYYGDAVHEASGDLARTAVLGMLATVGMLALFIGVCFEVAGGLILYRTQQKK